MASPPRKSAKNETVTIGPVDVAVVLDAVAEPVRELQENVRKVAEKGVEETRAAYARVEAAAEDATGSLEASYSLATKGIVEFNTKALEAARANTEAAFELARALFGVKSLSEAITLQSEHARKQYEAMTFQMKELAALAQKLMVDTSEPIKSSLTKTLSTAS
jgi:phasin